jgi:hypothetical protein
MSEPTPETAPPASASPPAALPPPPELQPAQTAFERGDFRAARHLTDQLLAGHPSPELESAARGLQSRMAIDPWAFRIALLSAALLFVIVGAYVL